MTTDTVAKVASASAGAATVVGIAKGVGMIEPDMATLIALFLTDAAIDRVALDVMFRRVIDRTFNCGEHRHRHVDQRHGSDHGQRAAGPVDLADLEAAVHSVALSLTKQIARDGEGARS